MFWVFFALRTLHPENLVWVDEDGWRAASQAARQLHLLSSLICHLFLLTTGSCVAFLPKRRRMETKFLSHMWIEQPLLGSRGRRWGDGAWRLEGARAWSSTPQCMGPGEDLLPAGLIPSSGPTARAPFRALRADFSLTCRQRAFTSYTQLPKRGKQD